MKLSHLGKCGGLALLRNDCRSLRFSFPAGENCQTTTATTNSRHRLVRITRDKVCLIAAPLLAGLAVRIALDAMADPAPGPVLTGPGIFSFALIPAVIGLLLYVLLPKEVLLEAKLKFFRPSTVWHLLRLTGWTHRVHLVFGKLLLERAWFSRRWRQSFNWSSLR